MWRGLQILMALRLEKRRHTDKNVVHGHRVHLAFKSVARSDLVKMSHSQQAVSCKSVILDQSRLSERQVNSLSPYSPFFLWSRGADIRERGRKEMIPPAPGSAF